MSGPKRFTIVLTPDEDKYDAAYETVLKMVALYNHKPLENYPAYGLQVKRIELNKAKLVLVIEEISTYTKMLMDKTPNEFKKLGIDILTTIRDFGPYEINNVRKQGQAAKMQ